MNKKANQMKAGFLFVLFAAGCAASGRKQQEDRQVTVSAEGQTPVSSPRPTRKAGEGEGTPEGAQAPDPGEKVQEAAPPPFGSEASGAVWAKDQTELYPGMEVEGVFDASREMIRLSIEQAGDAVKLLVDGEERLSVSANCEFFLQDILKEDSYLELLVGEPMMLSRDGGEEQAYYRVTAYHLYPGGLAEVPLLPSGEGNSFYFEEAGWKSRGVCNQYFGGSFLCYIYHPETKEWEQNRYQMMPTGYLMETRNALAWINMDGDMQSLPEKCVKIDEATGVGIAFLPDGSMMGTAHYNVYRSEDSGMTWSLVMDDFITASAEVDSIYMLDENTAICRFLPSGVVDGNSSAVYVTLDGGRTWEYIKGVEEMRKYDFLEYNIKWHGAY